MQIVPKSVSTNRVDLWIGSFRAPGAARLYRAGYRESGTTNWTSPCSCRPSTRTAPRGTPPGGALPPATI